MHTEERRRHRRRRMTKTLAARIRPNGVAFILDVSPGGALIEHTNPIRPGVVSFLSLSVDGHEVTLTFRAIRSKLHRHEVRPTGERVRIYRTGLEFSALSDESRLLLDEGLDALEKVTTSLTA